MQHTLKYHSIISLFFCCSLFFAQETKPQAPEKSKQKQAPEKNKTASTQTDSIAVAKTDRYGLRLGLDLYKITRALYDKNYKGIELVGDYRIRKNYYLAAELGNENKTTQDTRLTTTAKGSYLKVGFDYNAYENWLDMENMIYIGLRYGLSTFSQQLDSYKIYNTSTYFDNSPALESGQKFDGLTASWIEVVGGVKAKVFNNIFVGFSIQLKNLVTNKKPDALDNFYIPCFNRTYDGDFGIGFNYTITYFVPIYKKKTKVTTEIKEKKKQN